MRVLYEKRGVFDEIELPRFPKYRIKSIIQVNAEKNHFRVIKNNYNCVIILDGQEVSVLEQNKW